MLGRLGLVFLLLVGLLPSFAQAACETQTGTVTYSANTYLSANPCDLNGNEKVTLGTLLNTEIPATLSRYISVGSTEDEHVIKATAGTLFSISATNTAATVAYLKCENDTAANTAPGTDTPEFSMAIPGATTGGGFHVDFPLGVTFSNAWTCWIVTGAADSDVTEVGANAVMINYSYK